MSLILRTRIISGGAVVCAVWLAWQLAAGDYFWPALALALSLGASIVMAFRVPLDAIAVGGVLFGYLVGNRGFAQIMPVPGIPILPAEIALGISGAWIAFQCAFTRQLPFRRDALNGAVLLWLLVGTARVVFDVREHGFLAIRDFAMVYYAAFFFIAQQIATRRDGHRFLIGMLVAASVAQPIATLLSTAFPEFFYTTLTLRGIPLIFFKGDLALTFMAVSAFVLAFAVAGRLRWPALAVATLELMFVLGGDNRASALGAVGALAWLTFSRARRFVAGQFAGVVAAVAVMAALALFFEASWAERKFHGVAERVHSLTDFFGSGTYISDESSMKGDNNRFRSLWWKSVYEEALDQNPVFGLGFGHDLAAAFLREFNPEIADEFTARSPHSIVVSTIGRMGAIGLLVLLGLFAVFIVRTWRAMRDPTTSRAALGLWACVWTILISACFGVVLEGPMGAVVFWSLLGILSAGEPADEPSPAEAHPPEEKITEIPVAPLRSGRAADEMPLSRTT